MSTPIVKTYPSVFRHELEALQGNWVWYLVLGIVLIVLGTMALGAPFLFTVATVKIICALLILSGITQVVGAFWARRWSGFFSLLLVGILYSVVGIASFNHPVASAAGLTLVIAVFLLVEGIFRITAAFATKHPNWIWMLLNGVITLALGIMIWQQWPGASVWVIGTFIGIDLIMNGWTWVMMALAFRRIPVARSFAA